jgi:hypothetical protein
MFGNGGEFLAGAPYGTEADERLYSTLTSRLSDVRHFGAGVFDVIIWHLVAHLLRCVINDISAEAGHNDRHDADDDEVAEDDNDDDSDDHIFNPIRQSTTDVWFPKINTRPMAGAHLQVN